MQQWISTFGDAATVRESVPRGVEQTAASERGQPDRIERAARRRRGRPGGPRRDDVATTTVGHPDPLGPVQTHTMITMQPGNDPAVFYLGLPAGWPRQPPARAPNGPRAASRPGRSGELRPPCHCQHADDDHAGHHVTPAGGHAHHVQHGNDQIKQQRGAPNAGYRPPGHRRCWCRPARRRQSTSADSLRPCSAMRRRNSLPAAARRCPPAARIEDRRRPACA